MKCVLFLLQCLRKMLQKRMDPIFVWASERAAAYNCAWPIRTFIPEKDVVICVVTMFGRSRLGHSTL